MSHVKKIKVLTFGEYLYSLAVLKEELISRKLPCDMIGKDWDILTDITSDINFPLKGNVEEVTAYLMKLLPEVKYCEGLLALIPGYLVHKQAEFEHGLLSLPFKAAQERLEKADEDLKNLSVLVQEEEPGYKYRVVSEKVLRRLRNRYLKEVFWPDEEEGEDGEVLSLVLDTARESMMTFRG